MKFIQRIKENKLLILILIIGAILRFYRIDFQSVWLDEIHALNEANPNLSISELYNLLLIAEPHPPLYFILAHYLFIIFGYTTYVLRFFSATVGVLGIISVYSLGKEMVNKKVGLIAAVLLTINPFHINYSQEGRMYALLFLTTAVSFIYLIKFIKKPNFKSAILYSVFSTIMIYCHFFALFTLFSQYLILLYFLIFPIVITRTQFLRYCIVSAVITIILYIPTYHLFMKTSEMKSIWIQMPSSDAFTQIFKDFFGQSEMVLFLIIPVLLFLLLKLFNQEESKLVNLNPNDGNLLFSFLILLIWIFTTLFLPLVRTYISLPMLINRYFINVLPAILLLIAMGVYCIKSRLLQYFILSIIFIFSLNDIVIVKKYYKNVSKSQFREVSQFIIENNSQNDPVVSSLGWYFPFFLNNEKVKNVIIEKSLNDYINEMAQDSTKRKPFWYVDAHNRPYNVSETAKRYLDNNFIIDNNVDLFDAWAKHYMRNTGITTVNFLKYQPLKDKNGAAFALSVEVFENNGSTYNIHGWAYFEGETATDTTIELVLISNGKAFKIQSQKIKREDVTTYFKSAFDLSNSGFDAKGNTDKLHPGRYQLAINLKNKKTNKEGLVLTDKFLDKK